MLFLKPDTVEILCKKNISEEQINEIDRMLFKLFEINNYFLNAFENSKAKIIDINNQPTLELDNFRKEFETLIAPAYENFYNFIEKNSFIEIKKYYEITNYKIKEKILTIYKNFQSFIVNNYVTDFFSDSNFSFNNFKNANMMQEEFILRTNLTPFQILNVPFNASKKDIKNAFLKLSKIYHPDFNNSEYAEKMMVIINKAYEDLTKK